MLQKYLLPLSFILFLVLNVHSASAQNKELAVVAYYSGSPDNLEKYEIEKLTHIIFCFGHLKGNELNST